jgi:hypothetical protein
LLLLINAKVWDLEHGYYGTRKRNAFFGAVFTLKRSLHQDRLRTDTSTEPREERVLCRDRPSPDGDLGADNASLVCAILYQKARSISQDRLGTNIEKTPKKRCMCFAQAARLGRREDALHFAMLDSDENRFRSDTPLFAPFTYKNDYFTQTGSGQTIRKTPKKSGVSHT